MSQDSANEAESHKDGGRSIACHTAIFDSWDESAHGSFLDSCTEDGSYDRCQVRRGEVSVVRSHDFIHRSLKSMLAEEIEMSEESLMEDIVRKKPA